MSKILFKWVTSHPCYNNMERVVWEGKKWAITYDRVTSWFIIYNIDSDRGWCIALQDLVLGDYDASFVFDESMWFGTGIPTYIRNRVRKFWKLRRML